MLLARNLIDKGEKVIPIIDENAAHDYWEKYLGKGMPIYRTGKFIVEASKHWKLIDRGKAANYINGLTYCDGDVKKRLTGRLGFK